MAPRSISTDPAIDSPVDPAIEAVEPQIELHERSVGERLSQAREAAGLDLRQVSRELHLGADIILALETDRHSDLPQPAYVRGYIRAYARLLQLDSTALIERYNELGFADPKPACAPHAPIGTSEAGHRTAKIWGTIGVIAVLIGLLITWWLNQNLGEALSGNDILFEDALVAGSTGSLTPERAVALRLPVTETGAAAEAAAIMPENQPGSPKSAVRGVTYWTLQELEPAPSPAEVSMPFDDVAVGNRPAGEPAAPAAPPDAATAETEAVEVSHFDAVPVNPAPPARATDDHITVDLSEESWIEIYDANGQRLLYGLLDSGARHVLTGDAPFDVVLGNSPGVDLSVNGNPFDQSHFARGNGTARFTVGTPADN